MTGRRIRRNLTKWTLALAVTLMALGQPCARAVLLAPAENYDGEDFSGGNFEGQNGSQGSFLATSFNNASLIGTDLSASNLKEASFVSADLSGANSDASIFLNAVLDSANLSGCRSSQLDHRRMATAGAADVTRVNLGGNDRSSFVLSGLDLSAAPFINTNLGNAGLTDTNLTGADLSGANQFGASVSGASFTGSTLFSADLRLGGDTTAQGTGFVFTGYVKGAGAFTGTFELGQSPAIVTVENTPGSPVNACTCTATFCSLTSALYRRDH